MQDVNEWSIPAFSHTNNEPNQIVQNRELAQIIETALGKIPFNYRITFSLREINGMNVSETADLLEISESNVKVRLNRAKALLRKEIEKTYTPSELFEFNLVHCDGIVANVMQEINKL
jgi:RNA polymerase sigma-70 factor (ECF subfamily)